MPTLPVIDTNTARLALYGTKVGVDKHATALSARGTTIVKSVQIFKTGTFRDSWGDQQTWTHAHLHQMVLHFDLLKSSGAFPNVPVRNDHSFSVTDIIGYIEALRVDGDYLNADLEFTDATALEKFDNGTYRSRSIEIGLYETNNGETYYPVVMGLAFVDIPAVEGLHDRTKDGIHTFRQETPVPPETTNQATTNQPGSSTQPTFTFRIGNDATTDFAKVQAHIDRIQTENSALIAQNAQYEAAAAQAAIEARKTFVSSLATDGKILAPQVEGLTKLVESMDDNQFSAFKSVYENAGKVGLLQPHANAATISPNGAGAPPAGQDNVLSGEDLLFEKVRQFRLAGLTDDQIKNTPTGKALVAAGKSLDK